MCKFGFALLAMLLSTVDPLARGAAVNTITMTPMGTDTIFAIAGTFPSEFPTTPYSGPNTSYALTFTLPSSPTSFAFEDPSGLFVLDTSVTLNGVSSSNSQAAFFTQNLGGGVDVCIDEACSPDAPTVAPRFVVFTNPVQLFTGTLQKPVFISGPVSVDQSQTFIEAPVPEPGSLKTVLLGSCILSLAFFKKRTNKT
jgi:hypothetical protein